MDAAPGPVRRWSKKFRTESRSAQERARSPAPHHGKGRGHEFSPALEVMLLRPRTGALRQQIFRPALRRLLLCCESGNHLQEWLKPNFTRRPRAVFAHCAGLARRFPGLLGWQWSWLCMAEKFFGGNFTSAVFTTITDSCAGQAAWETHMKTSGIIPFVGLVLVVTVSNAAPINIDSRWRGIAASAGGFGATNLSTTAVGSLQATFLDSNVCGCLPFPGYGFNLEAGASQNTSVGLASNGVLSIAGQGRVHALTTLTVANQYATVAATSALDVQFTIDQPLP